MFSHKLAIVVALAVCFPMRVALSQPDYRYAFVPLPTLGGRDGFGYALNERGDVVGSSDLPASNDFHATMWSSLEPINLGTFGGRYSSARAINASGEVVGWATYEGGGLFDSFAFLWRDGEMIDLGTLGGDRAEAYGINADGAIVGWSKVLGNEERQAFKWEGGLMGSLPPLDGDGYGQGVNSPGTTVGHAWSDTAFGTWGGGWRAVRWENKAVIDLGTLLPDDTGQSWATAINDLGYVVGYSDLLATSDRHAFIWYDGRMYDLGKPQGTRSTLGLALNNLGQVVGQATTSRLDVYTAWLWELGRGMQKLDDLLPPRTWYQTDWASGINDAGQIAGTAHPQGNRDTFVAFLMSPVHPTLELESPSPGLAGESNTITISNVTPGATVQFLYSRRGGGTIIPGCDLQQNALQLDNPTVIGTAIANQNGVATITRPVPLIARGQTILFQAVVQGECAVSQLVVWRFE